MRLIIAISAMLLLVRCNSPKPNRTLTAAAESPAALKAPSYLMDADIDPIIRVDGLTKDELVQLFKTMHQADQQYRDSLNNGRKENETLFLRKMTANDEVNLKILDSIVKKYGWPRISVFGKDAAETAWLIVWHHRDKRSILCRYFDLMEKAVAEKEMNAISFQQIKERVEALSPDQIEY